MNSSAHQKTRWKSPSSELGVQNQPAAMDVLKIVYDTSVDHI